jgi:hypothetical protein
VILGYWLAHLLIHPFHRGSEDPVQAGLGSTCCLAGQLGEARVARGLREEFWTLTGPGACCWLPQCKDAKVGTQWGFCWERHIPGEGPKGGRWKLRGSGDLLSEFRSPELSNSRQRQWSYGQATNRRVTWSHLDAGRVVGGKLRGGRRAGLGPWQYPFRVLIVWPVSELSPPAGSGVFMSQA